MTNKFTDHDLKIIINNEGIGYAIQHYCSANDILNPKLQTLWSQAKEILDEIVLTTSIAEDSDLDTI